HGSGGTVGLWAMRTPSHGSGGTVGLWAMRTPSHGSGGTVGLWAMRTPSHGSGGAVGLWAMRTPSHGSGGTVGLWASSGNSGAARERPPTIAPAPCTRFQVKAKVTRKKTAKNADLPAKSLRMWMDLPLGQRILLPPLRRPVKPSVGRSSGATT